MAEGHTGNPLIIEPTPSPKASPPANFLTASPGPSSSSNSFNSSRPQSSCSYTSQSDVSTSPSENPKDVPLRDLADLGTSTPPEIDPLPPPSNLTQTSQPPGQSISPQSVPSNSSTNASNPSATATGGQASSFRSLRAKVHERRWLENTIGALGLATALWLGVRGYKIAVWQSWNDLRQLCSNYQQNNKTLGPRCSSLLEGNPPEPPYLFGNWGSSASATSSRLMKPRSLVLCKNPGGCHHDIDTSLELTLTALVIVAVIALIFVVVLIQIGRRKSRTIPPFTSPARSEHSYVHITRHHESGPETVSGQGKVVKEKPEEDHLAYLQRHMRCSQDLGKDHTYDAKWHSSNNTSAETLVSPWKDSRAPTNVSVLDESANEKHEGLIELEVAGKAKAFFKPSTGESIHLKPWKRPHHSDSDSDSDKDCLKSKAAEEGSVHRLLGQMLAGDVVWGEGKKVEKKMAEGLQKEVSRWGDERLRRRRQPPQRAGDCLAGEVTNEWPTGKPTLA